jgi:nitroreductase
LDPTQHQPDFPYDGRYPGVYKERQHDAAAQLYGAMGIARDDKAARGRAMLANYAFFGAPHAAFICLPEPFGLREAADCGIYLQTLMLLMTAKGLASCPQAALGFPAPVVREVLGLPSNLRVLFGLSFGFEDTTAPANQCRVGRAALNEAVSFHR